MYFIENHFYIYEIILQLSNFSYLKSWNLILKVLLLSDWFSQSNSILLLMQVILFVMQFFQFGEGQCMSAK